MRKKQTSYYKNRGFTLVEVIIVVAIMGILAAIALPSYTDMIQRNRVAKVARSFENTMSLAKRSASVSGRSVTVCPVVNTTVEFPVCSAAGWDTLVGGSEAGWIAFDDRNRDLERNAAVVGDPNSADEVVFDRKSIGSKGVSMSWTSPGRPNIVMTSRNTSGTAGTMRMYAPVSAGDPLAAWGGINTPLNDDFNEVRVRVSSLGKVTYEK